MSKKIHAILLNKSKSHFNHIKKIIETNGILTLEPDKEGLFIHMARLVINQQLSTKAARTIWLRIAKDIKKHSKYKTSLNIHKLKNLSSFGLSKNKTKAIICLKQAFLDKQIVEEKILESTHSRITQTVNKIWGFGDWSADMIAMFYCGLPNIWSNGDLALNKGLTILCEKENTKKEEILEHYKPHLSYLALHIWKHLD